MKNTEKRLDKTAKLTIAILDFNKPDEAKICMAELKKNLRVPAEIVYFSNGGPQDYVIDFYRAGLIDRLVLNKKNIGCGYGTWDLYDNCHTEFTLYLQIDQSLSVPLDEKAFAKMREKLSEAPKSVLGLAGDQCQGKYSERANICRTEWYKEISLNAPGGGPGPYQDIEHNEGYIQKFLIKSGGEFVLWEPFFKDNGMISVRQLSDGTQIRQFTDTKRLFFDGIPKQRHPTPRLTDEEWEMAMGGEWPEDGKIPDLQICNSFRCWPESY